MEWYAELASKWQRVLIAVVFVLLLVGVGLLRDLVRTEEGSPEKEKGTATRFLLRPLAEKMEARQA